MSGSAHPHGPLVAALDVGGTKLEAGVVDAEGTVLARHRVATPHSSTPPGDPDAAEELFELAVVILKRVLDEIRGCEGYGSSGRVAALGVGCGGPTEGIAPDVGALRVSPLNIAQWRGFPLGERLRQEMGVPVRVDNDAKALALAEGVHGAAEGVRDYLAMVVSTGVGGGIVIDGHLLDGAAGNAGHIGHVIVDPLGRRCACGARGCLEAEVSGSAIERFTGADPRDAPAEVRRYAGRLVGRAVGSLANLLDLRLAVLAGSVAIGFGEPFLDAAREEVDRVAVLDHSRGTEIRIGGLGADGPLVGAACVGRMVLDPGAAQ